MFCGIALDLPGDQFQFVVKSLDGAGRKLAVGAKPVQDQSPVLTQSAKQNSTPGLTITQINNINNKNNISLSFSGDLDWVWGIYDGPMRFSKSRSDVREAMIGTEVSTAGQERWTEAC